MKLKIKFVSCVNNYVKLPPVIVNKLLEQIYAGDNSASKDITLCIKITFEDKIIYVGWIGEQSSNNDEIEISNVFGKTLGLIENNWVETSVYKDVEETSFVNIEPMTEDDWEIVETQAELVEIKMLEQLKIVTKNMIFPFWFQQSHMLFKVVNICTQSSVDAECGKLILNSELVVSPKPRKKENIESNKINFKKRKLRVQPITQRHKELLSRTKTDFDTTVLVHPLMMKYFGWPFQIGDSAPILIWSTKKYSQSKDESTELKETKEDIKGETKKEKQLYSVAMLELSSEVNLGHIVLPDFLRNKTKSSLLSNVWIVPTSEKEIQYLMTQTMISNDNTETEISELDISIKQFLELEKSTTKKIKFKNSLENIWFHLGGVENEINNCITYLSSTLDSRQRKLNKHLNVIPPFGLLITGTSGSGKTLFIDTLASYFLFDRKYLCFPVNIDCTELANIQKLETILQKLRKYISLAIRRQPSLIIMDNIDQLIPNSDQENQDMNSVKSSQISSFLIESFNLLKLNNHQICLISTSTGSGWDSVSPLLRKFQIFADVIKLPDPNRKNRSEIMKKMLIKREINFKQDIFIENSKGFGSITEGYRCSDLNHLLERTVHICAMKKIKKNKNNNNLNNEKNDKKIKLKIEDFKEAVNGYIPLSLQGIQIHKSEVSWQDIGGLHEVKAVLKETLEWPTKYSNIYLNYPLKPRSGLLLFGPSGCGKTLLASAVASEFGVNFISVKGPELLNKYIGASEQSVRDLFERASSAKPCILFFDEFDSIAPRRGHDSTGVTDRVVNQFLTQLDGVESSVGIYVLAATSRPDLIDPALLRPGRLDKMLFCGMPNEIERTEILESICGKLNLDPNIDFSEISSLCTDRTGADLQGIISNAQLEAIRDVLKEDSKQFSKNKNQDDKKKNQFHILNSKDEILSLSEKTEISKKIKIMHQNISQNLETKNEENQNSEKIPVVNMEHLHKAFLETRLSISDKEKMKYERIYKSFLEDRGDFTKLQETKKMKETLA